MNVFVNVFKYSIADDWFVKTLLQNIYFASFCLSVL